MNTPSKSCVILLLAAVAALTLAGCGGVVTDSEPTSAALTSTMVLSPGPAGVGIVTRDDFEDLSRPTMPNGTFLGSNSRKLVTDILYPTNPDAQGSENAQRDAPVVRASRPYPLVIYSHGFMSSRSEGGYIARQLASYGYVVAAPDFPLSNAHAPGKPTVLDLGNQPGDVSFLIDRLLALNADPHSPFAGTIDATRIGLTGLSLGGSTTLLTTFHPSMHDPRVRAAAPMAGDACFFGKAFYGDSHVPLLILHGELDAIVPYRQNAVFAFGEANAPKYLVTLIGGTHTAFAEAAQLFETANNADDVGCSALSGAIQSDASFLDRLGGAAAGIIAGDCPAPCTDPRPRPHAMRPSRQRVIALLGIVPFFEAYLHDNSSARRFLEQALAAENADVTTEFVR